MQYLKIQIFAFLLGSTLNYSCGETRPNKAKVDTDNTMIRLAELEIEAVDVAAYIAILKKESEASVRLEPGVICIYPMFQKEDSTQIRLLEIYASKSAYEVHLQTSHFKEYKAKTLKMVKSLRLVDMEAIDKESMADIFKKLDK